MTETVTARPAAGAPPEPDTDELVAIYTTATRIKTFDESYRGEMLAGRVGGMYYSPRGQEIISAATARHLRTDDYLVTTYRGLHDQIAKGVPMRSLWSEYLGRAPGTCGGKGGPMHVTDPAHGLMVTTGVVGSGLPIANGLALSSRMRGTDQVTVVSFGDGATNIGAFHESLNLASVWQLPVVFVCQNNRYAEYTPYTQGTSSRTVADRGVAYSMAATTVDGNDPVAMYRAAGEAVHRARAGEGPTLIEALTFRFCGHVMGDSQPYISKEELAAAVAADPVPALRTTLLEAGVTDRQLVRIEDSARAEVADASEFAFAAPMPDVAQLTTDVYSQEVGA